MAYTYAEAKALSLTIWDRAYIRSGIVRWKSSERCVPMDLLFALMAVDPALSHMVELEAHEKVADAEFRAAMDAYIEKRAARTPEQVKADAICARAGVHGMEQSATLVNVLTGETIKL